MLSGIFQRENGSNFEQAPRFISFSNFGELVNDSEQVKQLVSLRRMSGLVFCDRGPRHVQYGVRKFHLRDAQFSTQ